VVRGVYVHSGAPDSVELRAEALSLVVPSGSVVCLRSAAWIWGVDASAMGGHRETPLTDLMGPPGSAALRRTSVSGRTGVLLPSDVLHQRGLIVTTPARTAADLSRLLRRPDALAALDAMLRVAGLTVDAVAAELSRFRGHRGIVQGRELLALADARSESPMESRTRLRAVDAGLPPFEPQVEVFDERARFVARVDLGRRTERKAVEYDGDAGHATPSQQAHDQRRRRRLEECGWAVAVVTAEHVLGRSLAFEHGISELLGEPFRLSRRHPRNGGWDRPWWAAA